MVPRMTRRPSSWLKRRNFGAAMVFMAAFPLEDGPGRGPSADAASLATCPDVRRVIDITDQQPISSSFPDVQWHIGESMFLIVVLDSRRFAAPSDAQLHTGE